MIIFHTAKIGVGCLLLFPVAKPTARRHRLNLNGLMNNHLSTISHQSSIITNQFLPPFTITVPSSTSLYTTHPAPITQLSPIVTPSRITTFDAILKTSTFQAAGPVKDFLPDFKPLSFLCTCQLMFLNPVKYMTIC